MIIDISQELFSCRVYPGDPAPRQERLMSTDRGDLYNLTSFSMCAHNGTHVDAPFHFLPEGKTVDELPLEAVIGPCYAAVFDGELRADDAERILSRAERAGAGKRILLAGSAVVTEEAALVFAVGGIRLLGCESQSVGPENAPMQVHLIFLRRGIVLLEGLVLRGVREGRYWLCAAPLKLGGCDGAPCRAVLITEEDREALK